MSFETLIENIKARAKDKVFAIGICGLSWSGKSTMANKLSACFPEQAAVINVDDFCTVPTKIRKSFLESALSAGDIEQLAYLAKHARSDDNPYADPISWYDWEAAADVIKKLRNRESVDRSNAWNQLTGECDKTIIYRPPALRNAVYFVDCIYLFEQPLSNQIDYMVLIDLDPAQAANREALRDRHRSDTTYLNYKKIVSELYCAPYLKKHRHQMDFILN
jgi:uridine kinase